MSKPLLWLTAVAVLAIACFSFYRVRTHHKVIAGSREIWVDGFSADFVSRDLINPEKSTTGRIYGNIVANPRGIRWETDSAGHRQIEILGGTHSSHVALDPETKTFWKPKMSARIAARASGPDHPVEPLTGGEQAKRKYLGRETLNDREAYHWEITEPLPNGNNLVWQYWEDFRLRSALREDKPGISLYELTNIREGKHPADLFDLPEGYREISAPQK